MTYHLIRVIQYIHIVVLDNMENREKCYSVTYLNMRGSVMDGGREGFYM